MLSKPDGQLSVEQDTITFVLNKLDPVSSKDEGPPGLEVRVVQSYVSWLQYHTLYSGISRSQVGTYIS